MTSHATASRPRAQKKDKGTSRRKLWAPFWPEPNSAATPYPCKTAAARPVGPEQHRFTRDVVTRLGVAAGKSRWVLRTRS